MEWILLIVGLILGAGAGWAIGYLLGERKHRHLANDHQIGLATAQQQAASFAEQLKRESDTSATLRQQLSTAQVQAASLATELKSAQANLTEQKQLLDTAQTKLKESFSSLSAEALKSNNEAFLHLARQRFDSLAKEAAGSLDERKAQIEGMLKPMNELLTQYQTRLGEIEKSRTEGYSMLREQLGSLAAIQRTLGDQTNQLVTAMRRPSTRGQWGELALKRLVELAGMTGRCDFTEQMTVDSEESRLRPDLVVHLPGDRDIVVDSKAVFDAFFEAASCTDEDMRKVHLQKHSQQVRARARELTARAYWNQFKRTPEFVIMFLPGEAFLYAAVEQDQALLEDCLKNKVIISTPTTLIALLKTIAFGWQQEDIAHNAEEIQKLGKELFDRIAVLGEHFAKLGGAIESTVGAYNKAVGTLETRVLVTARKMSELGARSDKEVPLLEQVDTRPRELPAALQ